MNTEKDPLKELFNALPKIEPKQGLKNRIMLSIQSNQTPRRYRWLVKPALTFASFLIIALVSTWMTLKILPNPDLQSHESAITQWASSTPQPWLSKRV